MRILSTHGFLFVYFRNRWYPSFHTPLEPLASQPNKLLWARAGGKTFNAYTHTFIRSIYMRLVVAVCFVHFTTPVNYPPYGNTLHSNGFLSNVVDSHVAAYNACGTCEPRNTHMNIQK